MQITDHQAPNNAAELRVFDDAATLNRATASQIVALARAAVERTGGFTIALSGGPAPGPVFELLVDETGPFRHQFPWDKTHFFWGDERHVPPTHPESNYRLAYDKMLSKAPAIEQNVHRVRAELAEADEAAELYELAVRDFFGLSEGEIPRFDLMWQGLGDNGHTASLFPGTSALEENSRLVVANWVEKLKAHRITMTFPVLNHAAKVLFLVSGSTAADALAQVLFGPLLSVPLPARRVAPGAGRLLWMVDCEAASRLPR